jgi:hypothetical protein
MTTQEVTLTSRKLVDDFRPIMGGSGQQAPAAPATQQQATPPEGGGQSQSNGQGSSDNALSDLETVQLTQQQLDELPEWARESLTKANKEAAGYRTKLRDKEQLIEQVGGEDRIKDLHWRTTTTEGIKSLFDEMTELDGIGEILGVEPDKLKGLLGHAQQQAQQQAAQQEARTGEALTPEEVEKLVKTKVEEAVAGVEQKQSQSQLQSVVKGHLDSKGYGDEWSFGLITQMAAKHQNDSDIDFSTGDQWSPYKQALDKGIADFEEWKKAQLSGAQQQYLEGKSGDASGTPTAASSSSPGTSEAWHPENLSWDELTKEAQKRGYFQ